MTAPFRLLHHFACTGGTLVSKCVASMPNVVLLNEIDPLSRLRTQGSRQPFIPTDIIGALLYSQRDEAGEAIIPMFRAAMDAARDNLERRGLYLVLRDHTHSHFCTGNQIEDRMTIRNMLSKTTPVRSVVTVRHPRDSYVSLVSRNWVHFSPSTIDEYANRYMSFLDCYADVPWHRYEDLVTDPETVLRRICTALELSFSARFSETLPLFALSGDSGRSGHQIAPRPRKPVPAELAQAMESSDAYRQLCDRLGYDHTEIASTSALLTRPRDSMKASLPMTTGLTTKSAVPSDFIYEAPVSIGFVEIRSKVCIGRHSYMNEGLIHPGTKIGRFCSIGRRITIGAGSHPTAGLTTSPFFQSMKNASALIRASARQNPFVEIGHDVWIGDNSVILSGVKIGHGAIIGAGAVVNKDVPPYAIVGGVPSKLLKWRFPQEIIEGLLEVEWWQYPDEVIRDLPVDNPAACIEMLRASSAAKQAFEPLGY